MRYEIEVLKTRFWTATLSPKRMADVLNSRSGNGWAFTFSITVERRIFLIFKRPAYYLIFQHSG